MMSNRLDFLVDFVQQAQSSEERILPHFPLAGPVDVGELRHFRGRYPSNLNPRLPLSEATNEEDVQAGAHKGSFVCFR